MLARPRKNSPARSLCLAALVLGLTAALPVCAAAETLQVSFTVEPYTSLELTESSIAFAPVPPGSSVEQTVQAIVKPMSRELRISGTQSATGPDGSGVMFIRDLYI